MLKAFGIILPFGFIPSVPLATYILSTFPMDVVFGILVVLGLIFGILTMIPVLAVQYATFLMFIVLRSSLYSCAIQMCGQQFGFRTFGRIYGTMMLISGGFNFSQVCDVMFWLCVFMIFVVLV